VVAPQQLLRGPAFMRRRSMANDPTGSRPPRGAQCDRRRRLIRKQGVLPDEEAADDQRDRHGDDEPHLRRVDEAGT